MYRSVIDFLRDRTGGASTEYALVSALAVVAGVSAIGAVQNGQSPFFNSLHRRVFQAIDEVNRALR